MSWWNTLRTGKSAEEPCLIWTKLLHFPGVNHSEVGYSVIVRWPFGVWTVGEVGTGSLSWEAWHPPLAMFPRIFRASLQDCLHCPAAGRDGEGVQWGTLPRCVCPGNAGHENWAPWRPDTGVWGSLLSTDTVENVLISHSVWPTATSTAKHIPLHRQTEGHSAAGT